jgi:trans-aconitate 2-methyltransferase
VFDLVVSYTALHWGLDQQAALNSIPAALNPGGTALLRFVPQGARKSIEDVLEETRSQARWSSHFAGFNAPFVHFTADGYRTLATRSGLAVKDIRVEERAWNFQTRDAFLAFCRVGCIAWLSKLPETDWTDFLTDLLDRYQIAAGNGPGEEQMFKFLQMEASLSRGEPA